MSISMRRSAWIPLSVQSAPEVYYLRLQNLRYSLNEQEVDHLHLRPVLVCELDKLIFAPIKQKLHVSPSKQIDHEILADAQESSNPTQYVPLWNIQLENSTSQMLDM